MEDLLEGSGVEGQKGLLRVFCCRAVYETRGLELENRERRRSGSNILDFLPDMAFGWQRVGYFKLTFILGCSRERKKTGQSEVIAGGFVGMDRIKARYVCGDTLFMIY